MNQEQLTYVTSQLAAGVTEDQIRNTLRENNYSDELITQLLVSAQHVQPVKKKSGWNIVFVIFGILALVIVVPIILLSLTVMTSLNGARDKGVDAAQMSQMNNFRATAELYFETNNLMYSGVCNEMRIEGVDCLDSTTAYRVSGELNTGEFYCVDSIGNADRLTMKPVGLSCDL